MTVVRTVCSLISARNDPSRIEPALPRMLRRFSMTTRTGRRVDGLSLRCIARMRCLVGRRSLPTKRILLPPSCRACPAPSHRSADRSTVRRSCAESGHQAFPSLLSQSHRAATRRRSAPGTPDWQDSSPRHCLPFLPWHPAQFSPYNVSNVRTVSGRGTSGPGRRLAGHSRIRSAQKAPARTPPRREDALVFIAWARLRHDPDASPASPHRAAPRAEPVEDA